MQVDITKNLNQTDRLLLGFVQNGQSDKAEQPMLLPEKPDWDDLLWQSRKHSVLSYAYYSFKETSASLVPDKYSEIFKTSFNNRRSKNVKALEELIKILQLFKKANIKNIILKGPYLAENIYPRPEMRAYDDIDVLVQKKNVERCKEIISQLGYEQIGDKGGLFEKQGRAQYHFRKSNKEMDLHWEPINNKWYPNVSSFFEEHIWQEARQINFKNATTWELSPEVLLTYQCIHLSIHHKFEKLIWFKDVDVVLRAAKIDWSSFIKKVKKYNLATYSYYALLFTRQLFSSPVPESVLEEIRPKYLSARIFEYLLNRENFFRLHDKKRKLAVQVWRICRDTFTERLKAFYWRFFPSIEWYLCYYPFLPKIKKIYYYPFYPLLIVLRLIRKPTNSLSLEE